MGLHMPEPATTTPGERPANFAVPTRASGMPQCNAGKSQENRRKITASLQVVSGVACYLLRALWGFQSRGATAVPRAMYDRGGSHGSSRELRTACGGTYPTATADVWRRAPLGWSGYHISRHGTDTCLGVCRAGCRAGAASARLPSRALSNDEVSRRLSEKEPVYQSIVAVGQMTDDNACSLLSNLM
jgi:hypothetical protein